jgi:hypothetical protein
MADISLSPAPSPAAPAPAEVAPRPAAAVPEAKTPDTNDAGDEEPTRPASTPTKATIAGAASPSGTLGSGLIPGGLLGGHENDSGSATSIERPLQPLPTVTRTGAVPVDTGTSLGSGVSGGSEVSEAVDQCARGDCTGAAAKEIGIPIGGAIGTSSVT